MAEDISSVQLIGVEDIVFSALAIRDTNNTLSDISSCIGFITKTIIIENGLNQILTLQLQGSRDKEFTKPINISSAFTVAATTDTYQTIADYFPFLRLKANCTVAPTTGVLNCYFEKVKS